MKINNELIDHLERLSLIRLTQEERPAVIQELEKLLSYMEILNQINVNQTEDLNHPFHHRNGFREDVVTPSLQRDEMLLNASQKADPYFIAPKTVL